MMKKNFKLGAKVAEKGPRHKKGPVFLRYAIGNASAWERCLKMNI
jgi:hypothetical protein